MSSAVDTIDKLLRLGALVHDKLDDADAPSDFSDFLDSDAYAEIKGSVETLVGGLSDKDVEEAIDAINDKREALLGGKKLEELSSEKMVQYLQLGDARRALRTKSMKVAASADFLGWVTNTLLPVLIKVGKTVIDLLL